MDLVSHALSGYVAGRSFEPRSDNGTRQDTAILTAACTVWAVLPDIDHVVEIFSPEDYLAWHRGPTHSLLFGILGGLLTSLVMRRRRPQLSLRLLWGFSLLGFATHSFLDLCTPFGTQPLWPFLTTRWSLDLLPPLDPVTVVWLGAGTLLVRFLWRDRRRGYRVLLGIHVAGILSLVFIHSEMRQRWEEQLPAGLASEGVVRHWSVPWRWVGFARGVRDGEERWYVRMLSLTREPEAIRNLVDLGVTTPLQGDIPLPPPSPGDSPPFVRHVRFPAVLAAPERGLEGIVDLQYFAIWPDVEALKRSAPFSLVPETAGSAGSDVFHTLSDRPPAEWPRELLSSLRMRTRGRLSALVLFAVVLGWVLFYARRSWRTSVPAA